MNPLKTIISPGLAVILVACSLTPPAPPLPDGEYRPVNRPAALKPLVDTPENLNGDGS